MEERPNILKSSLIAGVFVGVLSGLPLIGMVNVCFCLWVILGGILSSYILTSGFPYPVKSGDHAISGLLTGIFGAIISFVVSIPFMAISAKVFSGFIEALFSASGEGVPPELAEVLKHKGFALAAIPFYIALLIINMVIYGVFGVLGGLIGSALFKKQVKPEQVKTET